MKLVTNNNNFGVSNNLTYRVPSLQYVIAITNAAQAVVTFDEDHDYVVGEYISFRIENAFGMSELNNVRTLILAVTPTTVTCDVNTTNFNPFIYPVSGDYSPPITVPVASGINSNVPLAGTILDDAFTNYAINAPHVN